MAHLAERIRKRKIRELEYERQKAKLYSSQLNYYWNNKFAEAFGVPSYSLEMIDLTYYYDEMVRQYEKCKICSNKLHWLREKHNKEYCSAKCANIANNVKNKEGLWRKILVVKVVQEYHGEGVLKKDMSALNAGKHTSQKI